MPFPPLRFEKERLKLLDQRKLPEKEEWLECRSAEEVARAIREMVVRGAPAIGIAAGYGLYLGIRDFEGDAAGFLKALQAKAEILRKARPTAVNLSWAVGRIEKKAGTVLGGTGPKPQKAGPVPPRTVPALKRLILKEAKAIHQEDEALCRLIGKHGAKLFRAGDSILTHCNAGGLATSGYGTALAPLYTLREGGRLVQVYATETRPLLQGARLTAWELSRSKIPCTLICDSMVATLMKQGKIQKVIVGADRIVANGDTANKIGTYGIALLSQAHGIPFYVAAPSSTFDFSIASGARIPIEQRRAEEVTEGFGRRTAPRGIRVENPAFDVTPHELITAFVTEKGVIYPPFEKNLRVISHPEAALGGRRI